MNKELINLEKKFDHLKPEDYFDERYFYHGFDNHISGFNDFELMNDLRVWISYIELVGRLIGTGKIPRDSSALDAGCKFGFWLPYLQRFFGNKVYGFEVSPYALNRIKEFAPTAIIHRGDVQKISDLSCYADNQFDIIFALDILEHTRDFAASMNHLLSKLKKGGVLVISTPLRDTWAGTLFRWFLDRDRSHISVPEKKYLFQIVKEFDLEILEQKYYFPTWWGEMGWLPVSVRLVLRKKTKEG